MNACDYCPLKGCDTQCPRWPSNHVAYCNWVNPDHPNYKANGAETLIRIANREPIPLAPQQGAGSPPPAQSSPNPSVAQSLAIIAKMRACPSWEASSSCGCGNNICKSGKGRNGVVSHADCRACLEEQDALNEASQDSENAVKNS